MNASADLNKDTMNMSGFSGNDDIFSFNDDGGSGNNSFKFTDDEADDNAGVDFFASFDKPSSEGTGGMLF